MSWSTLLIHPMLIKNLIKFSVHLNSGSGSCITISKMAKLIALSSTEAEYIAIFEASKIIMWLSQFLLELGYPPTILYEDNKSAIHIVHNGNDKGRTKHMDIRYHYVRVLVQQHHILIIYRPTLTTLLTADILTKPVIASWNT